MADVYVLEATANSAVVGDMAWAVPEFPTPRVNAAGRAVARYFAVENDNEISEREVDEIPVHWAVVNNWRQAHNFPLNTFQMNLRNTATRIDGDNALIAQRIKRMVSIASKLVRFPTMNLTQMQDIGGCRAVVSSVDKVNEIVRHYRTKSRSKHRPGPVDDYITNPKASGYRGVHLMYRYQSDVKKTEYNGLKIEIQIRSRFQHAWATAVETVGLFTGHALKSSVGDARWLRFFALMGTVIARRENTPSIPGTPLRKKELVREVSQLAGQLDVVTRLNGYANALKYMENDIEDAHWYLLQLNPSVGELVISGFKKNEMQEAERRYSEAELAGKARKTDAVLVAVDSLADLPRAYPNYYADTNVFLELLAQARSGRMKRIGSTKVKAVEAQLSLPDTAPAGV